MPTVKPLIQYPDGVEEIRSGDTLPGGSGSGLPPGGVADQLLRKTSSVDGDATWGPKLTSGATLPASPADGDIHLLTGVPATAGGIVDSVVAGAGISVNNADPENPVVSAAVTSVAGKTGAVTIAGGDVVSGTVAPARLGSGTADTTTFLRGDGTWQPPPSGGGLTGFTGSQNTAVPNNTVNASRLFVDAASTNADAVVQPKGTGAFQLQLADGTATGGNKRGVGAVDLQLSRTASTQVASGNYSFTAGVNNTASANLAIAIGLTNSATGTSASVAIGNSNSASGLTTVAIGGNCQALGNQSLAIGTSAIATGLSATALGNQVTAGGASSIALGVQSSTTQLGILAHASGQFTALGDAQYERYVIRRSTSNATPAELSCDGNAPSAATRIAIANDSTYAFEAMIVARRSDADNESAAYLITGVIDNNAGTTAFVGTPTTTILAEDIAAWDVAVTADNTNDALVFTVTGEAAKTIRWIGTVKLTKVSG